MCTNVYKYTILNNIMDKDVHISINSYVSEVWNQEVDKYCKETGRVKSKLIQIAVSKYMKEYN